MGMMQLNMDAMETEKAKKELEGVLENLLSHCMSRRNVLVTRI